MSWKESVFRNFRLYAVTDGRKPGRSFFHAVEAAYRGGADIVQLRSKSLSDSELFAAGLVIRRIARRYHKLFFVNDRPDLALMLNADGVHLGQEDLPVKDVRRLCQRTAGHLWIGKSTHSVAQIKSGETEGADYLAVGPVFETPTKPDYPPVGFELVRYAARFCRIPFVAIGGVHQKNIGEVLRAGARRVAVVRAIFASQDPYASTLQMVDRIKKFHS